MQYIDEKTGKEIEEFYAILPLRDIVVFPHIIVPLFVGREKSICALEKTMVMDRQILLVTQKMLLMTIQPRKVFMMLALLLRFFNF
ncbi:ATP-dependent Lon protease [Bartonella sp. JB15]|nr:ATP-dependent Lon protease [Bartonella sp. JB15]